MELAEAQAAAGGRAWLSRFDHAPGLPPYDVARPDPRRGQRVPVGAPPRFVERPLLARPGGPMSPADLAVTAALHDSVLAVVRRRHAGDGLLAGWQAVRARRPLHARSSTLRRRVVADPDGERRRAWEAVAA